LRLRRRDKRLALLGGFPELIPVAPIKRFEPDLHEADRLKDVLDRITTLGAESFDEATGDPLDSSISIRRGRRSAAIRPGLPRDMAARRQGRVLENTGSGVQCQNADRAGIRPGSGAADEGDSRTGHIRRGPGWRRRRKMAN
jgi:hypothetical protein